MGIPLVNGLTKLDPGPRRFLFFIVFNVISWQCIVGPALILFARSLNMQASLIGFLISFMPLSMLLVGFTVPIVNRFGPKRVMFFGWLMRNLLACSVFAIPIIGTWGLRYTQYVLIATVLSFCVLRALGAGGWLPWLHELVPDVQRGTYFSMEAAITQITSVVVALIQAGLLWGHPSVWRFLMVYGIGIGAGLISLIWMSLIPGGDAPRVTTAANNSFSGYMLAFRNKSFMAFVTTASFGYASLALLLGSSLVLFMRDAASFSDSIIMTVTAAGALGIFLTIAAWGRFADYGGSGRAMFWSMLGHAVCAFACVLLAPEARYTAPLIWLTFIVASVFNAAYNVAANRAMLGYIPRQNRVVYTNVWSIVTSLAVGLPPIAAGYIIESLENGFQVCFIATAVLGAACALLSRKFVHEAAPGTASGPVDLPEETNSTPAISTEDAHRLAS